MDKRWANGQVKQGNVDLSPADGAEVSQSDESMPGPALGLNVVSGKSGYVTSQPIWNQQSSNMDTGDVVGGRVEGTQGLQDSTDEFATYKKVQTDEGLPQTYRTAAGAGDAGQASLDEPDKEGLFGSNDSNSGNEDTLPVPSSDAGEHDMAMPQTEATHNFGGGAPLFKRSK